MADLSILNVGGADYNLKDTVAREAAASGMSLAAYYEPNNTASQAYSVIGTPINWKGTLYYTKTAVAKNAAWAVGTNLTAATNLGVLTRNIKTYVGTDGKLHFTDLTGADSVLPFSGGTKDAINAICPFVLGSYAGGDQGTTRAASCMFPINGLTSINYRLSGYAHHGCQYVVKTLNASGSTVDTRTVTLTRDSSNHDYSISAINAVNFSVSISLATTEDYSGGHAWKVTILGAS